MRMLLSNEDDIWYSVYFGKDEKSVDKGKLMGGGEYQNLDIARGVAMGVLISAPKYGYSFVSKDTYSISEEGEWKLTDSEILFEFFAHDVDKKEDELATATA